MSNDTILGFFGPGVFNEMTEFGTYVEWGGEVYVDQSSDVLPQMGSRVRQRPWWDWDGKYDACCYEIAIVDQDG